MDFGKVLRRAWEITWRWKVLWILGFLASLGSGMGSGGNFYTYDGGEGVNLEPWTRGLPGEEFWVAFGVAVMALLCLGLIVAIALWVVSVIARGGLIAGVQQVEDEGSTTFRQAWRVGVNRFWTLFGIGVLAALPLLAGMLILSIGLVVGIVTAAEFPDLSDTAIASSILSLICCGGVLCCGLILVGLVLDVIRTYAERAAVLEGLGWIDAFKRGWEVLKDNLGPTIILWLIFLAIGLALAMVVFFGVMGLVVPLMGLFTFVEPGPWIVVPACFGGLLALIVFAVLGSVVNTFTSASWTLAYRELTGWQPPAAGAVVEPPEDSLEELLAEG